MKFKDPRDACAAIVAESYRLWLQYETRTDDITIIVVHINGLTDVRACLALVFLVLIPFLVDRQVLSSPLGNILSPFQIESIQNMPDVPVRPLQQIVEVTGTESPSTISWNSRNHHARHDLSHARLKAIESSLENGHAWVPPSLPHRKTWEEEVCNAYVFISAKDLY